MASAKVSFSRAITAHREAQGLLQAIRDRLDRLEADSVHSAESAQEQTALAAQLERSAAQAAPNWLGASWSVIDHERFALEVDARPGDRVMIRIGDAQPLPGVGFPVIVPFIGVGHLVIDRDAREPAVAGLLRSVLARLLAAFPAGMLRILAVDGGALGAPLAPFRALVPAGVMQEPVTELDEFRGVLDQAEEQVRRVQSGAWTDPDVVVIAAAALPPGCTRADHQRIAAIAHAGPAARVHLLLAGYPPPGAAAEQRSQLERSTVLVLDSSSRGVYRVGDPPGESFGASGLNVPVALDSSPPIDLLDELCRRVAHRAESEGVLEFDDLVPAELWTESSVRGLTTVVGRVGRGDALLSLDDATPHWLVGGRTGSGKTVFLLDVLYGLSARYSPDEMALYLLDFKEGVSFTEFMPTERDPTWLPHARAVGVESDREYGMAVLTELVREMSRRGALMKRAGVSDLAQLRGSSSAAPVPRIVCVIDEFHVLLQGKDETSRRAADLLEEVARKGRSFGVHLILASQSVAGIEALYTKGPTVYGQFGLRVALSGAGGVLDARNHAADVLPVGQVVLNDAGGAESGNRRVRFPDADKHSIALLRHRLWQERTPGAPPPATFVGYAEYSVSSALESLSPRARRRVALIGRNVDVAMSTAAFPLEASPGRHLAAVGTSPVGADLLDAVALGLAHQHEPGSAAFYLCSLIGQSDEQVDELAGELGRAGHLAEVLELAGYRDCLGRLASSTLPGANYVFVYGADVAHTLLKQRTGASSGLDDLRTLLREGPSRGTHLFGWWRGVRQLGEDLGVAGKDDIAGIIALNVRGNELGLQIGQPTLTWTPRANRVLLIDRQQDTRSLVMPFVRPGRYAEDAYS